jgi:transcriptional regulator with XRE-family HTH domain
MTTAGSAIKTMRKAMDLSQRGLAVKAGVSPSFLSRVERGLDEPSPTWLAAVTRALGEHLGERTA